MREVLQQGRLEGKLPLTTKGVAVIARVVRCATGHDARVCERHCANGGDALNAKHCHYNRNHWIDLGTASRNGTSGGV